MTAPFQASLLPLMAPRTAPEAPAGVKRAARCGSRGVDPAVIAACRELVGQEVSEVAFWQRVHARCPCLPDSARRRRDVLEGLGLLSTTRPEGTTGIVRIEWVKA